MQRRPFDAGWVRTVAWRAAVGPAVLLLTAIGLMAIRLMSEPSLAAALRAEAFFQAARAGDVASLQKPSSTDGIRSFLARPARADARSCRRQRSTAGGGGVAAGPRGGHRRVRAGLRDVARDRRCQPGRLGHGRDAAGPPGPTPTRRAYDGVTPLMQAAMWDNADAVAMLLRAGRDPTLVRSPAPPPVPSPRPTATSGSAPVGRRGGGGERMCGQSWAWA